MKSMQGHAGCTDVTLLSATDPSQCCNHEPRSIATTRNSPTDSRQRWLVRDRHRQDTQKSRRNEKRCHSILSAREAGSRHDPFISHQCVTNAYIQRELSAGARAPKWIILKLTQFGNQSSAVLCSNGSATGGPPDPYTGAGRSKGAAAAECHAAPATPSAAPHVAPGPQWPGHEDLAVQLAAGTYEDVPGRDRLPSRLNKEGRGGCVMP